MAPSPDELRSRYRAFLRPDRILLTGHSHQAWPDVAREGLLQSFADAALHVDDKWAAAFAAADAVRDAVVARIGGRRDQVALGQSTHELVARFLSSLPLLRRRHLVTTGAEFHSLRRQLARLAEEGVEVTVVAPMPVATLGARLAAAIRDDTAAVLASTVLFETSTIVPGLAEVTERAQRAGAHVLYDAYHAFNIVPFDLADLGPDPVFVVAGGYKYAQWGEGCCFLRVPPECDLRPVYTGWFADFESLEASTATTGAVGYGRSGAQRFAGSTYDPASHYRARAVIGMFDELGLDVPTLRRLSQEQTTRLVEGLEDSFELVSPREPGERGGFVAFRAPDAAALVRALRARAVYADARGPLLRLGPAPYTTTSDLDTAITLLR